MASKSNVKVSNSFEKKIREIAEERMKCALDKSENSITEALGIIYEKVIADFYEDRHQKCYVRTYTTYQAGLDIDIPTPRISNPKARTSSTTTRIKNGYCKTIKVMVSSEFMHPIRTRKNQYHGPDDCDDPIGWVFDRTFNKGIHGTSFLDNPVKALGEDAKSVRVFKKKRSRRIRSDRTPAIRWQHSVRNFVKSKKGPRLAGISSTCSLDYIMRESYEYARRKIR